MRLQTSVCGRFAEKFAQVNDNVIWPETNGRSLCAPYIEAHHGFVNGTDLLHIQRPVREPFALQLQQIAKDAVHYAIGDMRSCDRFI